MGLNKIVVGLWVKSSNFHEFAIKDRMASVCTNMPPLTEMLY